MPETYHPTIQTVEIIIKVMGIQILPNDLIIIFLQEAEHHTIETGQAKQVEAAMSISSCVKKQLKRNSKGKERGKSHMMYNNCCKGTFIPLLLSSSIPPVYMSITNTSVPPPGTIPQV
jgi:hypothetical protein